MPAPAIPPTVAMFPKLLTVNSGAPEGVTNCKWSFPLSCWYRPAVAFVVFAIGYDSTTNFEHQILFEALETENWALKIRLRPAAEYPEGITPTGPFATKFKPVAAMPVRVMVP